MPNYAFLISLLLFSTLARIKLPFADIGMHYPLILGVGLMTTTWNFSDLQSWIKQYKILSIIFLIFYLWVWVSAGLSEFPETAIRYAMKYSTYAIAFLGFSVLTFDKQITRRYDKWLWIFLIIIAFGGLLEVVFPHLWILNIIRYPDHYPRISSIVQGPNQLGVLMALAVIFSLTLYHRKILSKGECYLALLPFLALTCLSASRNGWLVLTIGLLLVLFYKITKPKTFLILAILWIVFLLSFPVSAERIIPNFQLLQINPSVENSVSIETLPSTSPQAEENKDSSDEVRMKLWKAAIAESINRPITGIGVGVFAEHIGSRLYKRTGFHAHNIFLSVLVELGIPGLVIFLGAIACLIVIVKHKPPAIAIPLILIGCSQQVDFFINDYTFAIVALYILSSAINYQPSVR